MSAIPLTLAVNAYNHVQDLFTGAVRVEGVDLTCLSYDVEEIFFRFSKYREWDVSELSLAKYCALRASGDDSLVAIPVFPSRVFRHSAIFVRGDGAIAEPADLHGRAIGIPEWTQTATVYGRGLLQHDYGVDLRSVSWVQGGVNEAGRVEGIPVAVPEGVRYRSEPEYSLAELLLSGEIDAMIAAHPPNEFKAQTGEIVRLVQDYPRAERTYFERTGVFPIMHLIAIKRDVYEAHPWIAMNLLSAFTRAKQRTLEDLVSQNASLVPVPWSFAHAEEARRLFGHDYWPYGVEPNRKTLEAFLGYAHEQGVLARELLVDELFAVETADAFRV